MNQIIVKKCSVYDIENAPNVVGLLDEYSHECAIEGLPVPTANWPLYTKLEINGALQFLSATSNGWLIGLATVISTIVPHYAAITSVMESLFVLPEYRKTGAGLKLMRLAEKHAKEMGATGLLISAPFYGSLVNLLEKDNNYKETNRVFFRSFK